MGRHKKSNKRIHERTRAVTKRLKMNKEIWYRVLESTEAGNAY